MHVKNVNANLLSKISKQITKTRSKAETFPKCHPFWLPLVQTTLNFELMHLDVLRSRIFWTLVFIEISSTSYFGFSPFSSAAISVMSYWLIDFWHETQKQRVNKSVQFANPPPLCHHSWPSSIWRLLTTLDVKLPDFYCLLLFTTSSNINRASSFRDPDFSIYI